MIAYTSEQLYIESATSLTDKIAKIDAVILALYDVLIKAALKDHITEYSLDDGQTKITTDYRGAQSVQKSISALEFAKQVIITRLNKNQTGSIIGLVDSQNLTGRNGRNNRY